MASFPRLGASVPRIFAMWSFACLLAMTARAQRTPIQPEPTTGASSAPTYTRDIAPLLWTRCGECHRPNGVGPFSLLTFDDVRQRAQQIAEVTRTGVMPPWVPDADGNRFEHDRRMAQREIELIERWVRGGRARGDAKDLPPMPAWNDSWRLGQPDLIVELPEYTVPASDGSDVFRNFVVSVPTDAVRYVKGLEFIAGNTSVHHANIYLDETGGSKQLDDSDPQPGYSGLIPYSAHFPDGHFLGWTPGQAAPIEPDALAWTLPARSSLLVQLHLRATGKPERIHPRIGLFFAATPPTERPVMLRVGRQDIDIPAGLPNVVMRDRFVLPTAATLHAVQAHSHYRTRSMRASATLPDGTVRPLLSISHWNFDWQDVYRYIEPIELPRGTTIVTEYVMDNSDGNPRNPMRPPTRAVWGFRSADEMADVWFQFTADNERDRQLLQGAADTAMTAASIAGYETQIRANPNYIVTRNDVAVLYMDSGQPAKAIPHLARVVTLEPASAAARFNLARAQQATGDADGAIQNYLAALRIDPSYDRARGGMAEALYIQGAARDERGDYRGAAEALAEALQYRPDWADAMSHLAWVVATGQGFTTADRVDALNTALRARELTNGRDPSVLDSLGAVYASLGRFDEARAVEEQALVIAIARAPEQRAEIESRLKLYREGKAIERGGK